MNKAKKTILSVLAVIVGLAVLYILFNMVDAPKPVLNIGEGIDDTSLETMSDTLYGLPDFGKENGYFQLWTLTAPLDVDIQSEETLFKFRRMHDPGEKDHLKYCNEYASRDENWRVKGDFRGFFKKYMDKRKQILKNSAVFDTWSGASTREWTQLIKTHKDAVHELRDLYAPFLERYQKMMESKYFKDFTYPHHESTIPNLLAYLQVAKLYNTAYMQEALENGQWENAVARILDNIQFSKRVVRGHRTLILNLVAKALIRESAHALVALMNEPEFPKELYKTVVDGLPPMGHEDFAAFNSLAIEGYMTANSVEGGFLKQQNRTRRYYYDFVETLAGNEKTPPYKWDKLPTDLSYKNGIFWWLQNPRGKSHFEIFIKKREVSNLNVVTFKSYGVKASYDMACIAAELHLNYVPGKPVQEILDSLEIYKTRIDDCSGKPYKWNEQKQVLYGIGTDRDDDGGKFNLKTTDTDYAIPVVLFIKD